MLRISLRLVLPEFHEGRSIGGIRMCFVGFVAFGKW